LLRDELGGSLLDDVPSSDGVVVADVPGGGGLDTPKLEVAVMDRVPLWIGVGSLTPVEVGSIGEGDCSPWSCGRDFITS